MRIRSRCLLSRRTARSLVILSDTLFATRPLSERVSRTPKTSLTRALQQCDELKPGCRNCEKSKRECLGYDLTSKPLTGQTPIQPAPSDTQPSVTPTLSSYPHNTLPVLPVAAGAFASTSSMDGMDYAPLDPQLGGDSVSTISGYEQSTSLRPERKGSHSQLASPQPTSLLTPWQ